MNFLIMLIEFILKLFFTFLSIKITDKITFGMLIASIIIVALFIKFFKNLGGSNND